ncbi:MAG: EAL domain-containing protein, partial [Wujia sp.]
MLCDNSFRLFFEYLMENSIDDLSGMNNLITNALKYVAEEVHIGRVEMNLLTPISSFEMTGNNVHETIVFSKNGCNDNQVVSREYKTGDNGLFRINFYPEKNVTWNEEEKTDVYLLCGSIILFGGRSRLNIIAEKAVYYDANTGVMNTNGLGKYVGPLVAKGIIQDYSGIFLNIKNFKFINKRSSSKIGDLCLFQYAQSLARYVGDAGVVSRLGGDNFFIIIRKDKVRDFIKNVKLSNVVCVLNGKEHEFELECRVGLYECQPGDTMTELMNNANIAINVSRNTSNDVVVFRQEMLEYTYRVKEISMSFPKALENEEFVVYYQPKVDLKTETICGCEALVRWIRDGKLVPPMDFIPILEQEGSVCILDFYVLEHVCKDIRKWIDSGIEPVRVSVNFSKLHLHNKMLANRIISIMDKYSVESKYIEIEITEMSGYEDYSVLSEFVDIMNMEGIHTSIDDFGTGYSSMNLIKDLNVDIIKLDKSFLNDGANRTFRETVLLRNIVNMINELG